MNDKPQARIRGHCADCGYAAWLDAAGLVPEHVVRRVHRGPNGAPQVYPGTADGDDSCDGAGRPPAPLPRPEMPKRERAQRLLSAMGLGRMVA